MIQMYADCSWFLLTRFVDKTEKESENCFLSSP